MDIYKSIIDWMWENTWDSKKPVSLLYVVSHEPPVFRGLASPRQCVSNAVHNYNQGNISLAANWLMAGVAHDPESRDELFRNMASALNYAASSYPVQSSGTMNGKGTASPGELRDILLKCLNSMKDREVSWKDFSETSSYKNSHIET